MISTTSWCCIACTTRATRTGSTPWTWSLGSRPAGRRGTRDWGCSVAVPSAAVASAGLSRNCALQSALAPEAGQTYATFLLFSDLMGVLPNGTSCQFANTEDDCGVTTAQEYILTLTLTSPITDLNTQAVDPFVFRSDDRGVEVHLPGLAPTDLATPGLFGTRDDATATTAGVPSGHYYLTANHLPWALDVATEWRWPLEETSLLSVYPDFAAWAQSGGGSNPGWYLAGAANVVTSLRYSATIPVDGTCVCPSHSHVTGGVCVCDGGYTPDGLGACVTMDLCDGVICPEAPTCRADGMCVDGVCEYAPISSAPLPCGEGICAHTYRECNDGVEESCDPWLGATDETCNLLDDDCDGAVDNGFDLQADPLNCGACVVVCGAAQSCFSGICAPTVCDDLNFCNGIETRDPVNQQCVAGTPLSCPPDECHAAPGTCVPADGSCAYPEVVYTGNYVLKDQASLDALDCVERITGNVSITTTQTPTPFTPLTQLTFKRLRTINGSLTLSNSALVSMDLGPLATVGASISITGDAQLTGIDLSGITTLTNGTVSIAEHPALTSLVLPPGGLVKSLRVSGVPSLQAVNLDVLPAVMTQLYLGYASGNPNTMLSDIGSNKLSQLTQVTGLLYVGRNSALGEVDLDNLVSVGGAFTVTQNDALTTLGDADLGQLASIGGNIVVSTNPNLKRVDFSGVTTFPTGVVTVAANGKLEFLALPPSGLVKSLTLYGDSSLLTVDLDVLPPVMTQLYLGYASGGYNTLLSNIGSNKLSHLTQVTGILGIHRNPALAEIDLDQLVLVGSTLAVTENENLVSLGSEGLGNLTSVGGTITINTNAKLAAVDLSGVTSLPNGTVNVTTNAALDSLVLPPAGLVKSLTLYGDGSLPAVNLDVLPAVMTRLYLGHASGGYNTMLSDIGSNKLSQLTQVTDLLAIARNPALTEVDLGNLTSVGTSLTVSENDHLSSLGGTGLGQLATVGGAMTITHNPVLSALDLHAITTVGGAIVLGDNPGVPTIDLSGVTSFPSGSVQIYNDDNLTSLSLPPGGSVKWLYLYGVPSLQAVNLDVLSPEMTRLYLGHPSGANNTMLSNIGSNRLSQLTQVTGLLYIGRNAALTEVNLDNLTSVGSTLTVSENSQLSSLGGMGLGNLTTVGNTATITLNPMLTKIDLSGVTSLPTGRLVVGANAGLTSLVLPPAGLVKSLSLYGLVSLQSVNLDVLPPVMTELNLGYASGSPNTILSDIGSNKLSQLTEVTGALYIASSPGLFEVNLDHLTSVGSTFRISSNGGLTSIGSTTLGSLTNLGGTLTVQTNPQLMFCKPQSDAIKVRIPAATITYSGNACSP